MASTGQDFTTYQGDAVSPVFTVKDAAGAIVDISTVSEIQWNARRITDAAPVLTKTKTGSQIEFVTNGTDGKFKVIIAAADTALLSGLYLHEAIIVDTAGSPTTVAIGQLAVGLASATTRKPNDLTDLDTVKAWLGIPSGPSASDYLLNMLISAWSRAMLTYISRGSLLSSSSTVRLDGTGSGRIMLPRFPVTSVSAVSIDNVAIQASPVPAPGAATPNGFLLETWDGTPPGRPQVLDVFGSCFGRGRQNVAVTMTAGYLVADEALTISAAPYPVAAPYGPFAQDAGVTKASVAMTKVASGPASGQYAVDGAGNYSFAAADVGQAVLVSYSFVPADLAQLAAALVGEDFRYKDRIGQVSKSLGGQETASFSTVAIPARYKIILDQYANVLPI